MCVCVCVGVCVCNTYTMQSNYKPFPINARGADAARSYRNLLNIPKGNLSDPLTEHDCWLTESEGLKNGSRFPEDLSVLLKKWGLIQTLPT